MTWIVRLEYVYQTSEKNLSLSSSNKQDFYLNRHKQPSNIFVLFDLFAVHGAYRWKWNKASISKKGEYQLCISEQSKFTSDKCQFVVGGIIGYK